ncbi:MAG: hypothetical protein K8R88_07405 [Armatimonadetes bacterium]|nr:hypothetical protein [Armatimonadota bacterium]
MRKLRSFAALSAVLLSALPGWSARTESFLEPIANMMPALFGLGGYSMKPMVLLFDIEDVGSRLVTVNVVLGDPNEIGGVGSRLVTVNYEKPGAGDIEGVGSRLVTVSYEKAGAGDIEFVGSRLVTVYYDPYKNEDVGSRMYTVDGTATLTLNVNFLDVPPELAPTNIMVDYFTNDVTPVQIASHSATLVNGQCTLPVNTRQKLSVRVRQNETWLGKKQLVDFRAGDNTATISLLNGDCNADNVVDLTDYTVIVVAFNALPSSSNWDATADLNRDEVVDLTDYTIVVTNFNQVGD